MENTYLLIEVIKSTTQPTIIEDIHGVSSSIDTLKEVAFEENDDQPLDWKVEGFAGTPTAKRTTGKGEETEFQIIQTRKF